jgi:hypothetical protein
MQIGDLVLGKGDNKIGIVIRIWSETARVVLWPCGMDTLCHINSLVAL